MTDKNSDEIIFSKVYVNVSLAEDNIPSEGISVGDVISLSILWRVAVKNDDGTYSLKAFNQKHGEVAEDVTDTVFSKFVPSKSLSKEDAIEALERFNALNKHELHGYPEYTEELTPDVALDKRKLERFIPEKAVT